MPLHWIKIYNAVTPTHWCHIAYPVIAILQIFKTALMCPLSLHRLLPLYFRQDFRITHHSDLSPLDISQSITLLKWQPELNTLCHSILFLQNICCPSILAHPHRRNMTQCHWCLGQWNVSRSVPLWRRPLRTSLGFQHLFLSSLPWF